jgi:phytoene dehydrogenase-like protein
VKTAIVIGGGHNGLIAAFYLAKAGVKPIVLEARDAVGGGAATSEIHPGFRCPTLTHEVLLQQRIVHDMDLGRHGLQLLTSPTHVCSLSAAGPLVIDDEPARTQQSIKRFNAKDAEAFPEFQSALQRTASVLASAFEYVPPSIVNPGAADLWNLLKTARTFRSLGKRDAHRLLRWGPMPVADLMHEWFEHELLRATIAAPALIGTMLGPRSAGSSLVLLMREAHRQLAGGSPLRVKGGPGFAAHALANRRASCWCRDSDCKPGRSHRRDDGTVRGVKAGGRTIEADVVLSSADPKTTFLRLIEPPELSPDFAGKIQNYRANGTVAKVNLALSSLPDFGCAPEALTGRIQIGASLDYLERAFDHAKYGEFSAQPLARADDPVAAR